MSSLTRSSRADLGPEVQPSKIRNFPFGQTSSILLAAVDRLQERWIGNGISGEEFELPDHVYARDLKLFGKGSLFERLCVARSYLGRERLASYLQEPAGFDEIRQRQAAVRELAPRKDLREKLALLGRYEFEQSRRQTFAEWLDNPPVEFASWLHPAVRASSIVLGILTLTVMLS